MSTTVSFDRLGLLMLLLTPAELCAFCYDGKCGHWSWQGLRFCQPSSAICAQAGQNGVVAEGNTAPEQKGGAG